MSIKTKLDVSARDLLNHLRLPISHPLCGEDDGVGVYDESERENILSQIAAGTIFELPNINAAATATNTVTANAADTRVQLSQPSIGATSLLELHDHSISDALLTATNLSAPSLAMTELWLRLFAIFLGPLCLMYWVRHEFIAATKTTKTNRIETKKNQDSKVEEGDVTTAKEDTTMTMHFIICIVGLASSSVIFTDSLYVYEYGRWFGLYHFVLSSVMAVRCASSAPANYLYRFAISLIIAVTIIVYLRSDGGNAMKNVATAILHYPPFIFLERHLTLRFTNTAAAAIILESNDNPLPHIPHPGIDLPSINEGFYYSTNSLITTIVSNWPKSSRTYNIENGATPYLANGDQRTGIPFLVNSVEDQEYVRVWAQNQFDGEYFALDIAFPYSNRFIDDNATKEDDTEQKQHKNSMLVHDLTKPVYLLLHGLNGGSQEEFIKDMVKRRREEGSTVVVMIARGMMDTHLVTWNTFHGARTGDVDAAARVLRRGLTTLADAHNVRKRQLLAGVGYSTGGVILSNFVARSGQDCGTTPLIGSFKFNATPPAILIISYVILSALDAAMSISGGLDLRQQLNFKRSMRLWQPMLTHSWREDVLIGKNAKYYRDRLTRERFLGMLRATSLSDIDAQAIVTYNSFDNLLHYYSEMSAMGDREPEFELLGPSDSKSPRNKWGRIGNISIPFAFLMALDDPIVGWRTLGTTDLQGLVNSGSGKIMLLLTKAGGHVLYTHANSHRKGWPLGNNPAKYAWEWMNNAARDFIIAVDIATREAGYESL
ncbi:hypothetical protein ACHAXA_006652 [Cyclostephanos tholiformis]|uniref:AB hydrolase-1 domain-containing protein n=1 Tax=Cyclostephanos tholiformis TaxID=382380 RepID=A0ABD3REI2_9STRA